MPKEEHGIAVYELLPNGCINGVYAETERALHNGIFNEILRKKVARNGLDGEYTSVAIDLNNEILVYDVELRDKAGKIQIQWLKDGVAKYEGTGWKTRENQLTVSYRKLADVV